MLACACAASRGRRSLLRMTQDVFTEPKLDPHTLANLGPLTGMAGVWEGSEGADVHPVVEGSEPDRYVEHYELQPIDPQTNGPQYFYGLRYHKHITKPDEVETFHDQVGYWLWNPVEETVTLTIAIPRGAGRVGIGTGHGGHEDLHVASRAWRDDIRHLLEPVPRAHVQDLVVHRHGHGERRRHVGLRRGHRARAA